MDQGHKRLEVMEVQEGCICSLLHSNMKYKAHNEIVASAYDGFAESEEHRTKFGLSRLEADTIKQKLLQHIPKESRVADIGSGPGVFSLWLAENDYKVDLVDVSERSLELAKYRASKMSCNNNLSFFNGAADDLSFLNKKYSAILEFGPIYHAMSEIHIKDMIEEATSHLYSGGLFIFCYANAPKVILELVENKRYELALESIDRIKVNGWALIKPELDDLGTLISTKDCINKVLVDNNLQVIDQFGVEQIHSNRDDRNDFTVRTKADNKLSSLVRKMSESSLYLEHSRFVFLVTKKA